MTSFGDAQHQETTDSQETGGGGSLSASLTYLTAVSTSIRVLGPQRTQIFYQPYWQIENGILNRPIMARTQILVLR